MAKYTDFNKRERANSLTSTPQSNQARADQTPNNAGGWGWKTDELEQLTRFFILGTTQKTVYIGQDKLTEQNLSVLRRACESNGEAVLDLLIDIRKNNRSKSRETLLVGYAYVLAFGNEAAKQRAYAALNSEFKVNLKQLLSLIGYAMNVRKSSRGLKNMIRRYFLNTSDSNLAYQVAKYSSGQGWTPRDLIRLAHVEAKGDNDLAALLEYLKPDRNKKNESGSKVAPPTIDPSNEALKIIYGRDLAQHANNKDDVESTVELIKQYGLTREMISDSPAIANSKEVWEALLPNLGVESVLWSLSKFATLGLLDKGKDNATNLEIIRSKLSIDSLTKGNVHPMKVYMAYQTYVRGHSVDHGRGSKTWDVNPEISELLNEAFIALFKTQNRIQGKVEVGIDVSGSMAGTKVNGSDLTAVEGAGVIAYALCQAQPAADFHSVAYDDEIHAFPMTKRMSLEDTTKKINEMINGWTDCALPILDALKNKRHVDVFVIITDSETWQGRIHPYEAMKQYAKINPHAKLVVAAVASNSETIADPENPNQMNVVGFDASILDIIRDFANGEIK